jgi:ribose/xylose/arabinose/galactoside ABC-type transport system permease subunit
VSEPSDETQHGEPVDPGGVTQPWPPVEQPPAPPQDPPGQSVPGGGQPFSPAGQHGIEPGALETQGAGPGTFQAAAPGTFQAAAPAPRDRVSVHLLWELVLLLIAVALIREAFAATSRSNFDAVFGTTGYTGLVASGLALSLRTATPNLAVGSIATFTGMLGAHLISADGWSLWAGMIMAVAIAAVVGLVTGLIVAALSVPAWAVTLAVAVLLQSAALGIAHGQIIVLHVSSNFPAALWLAIFAVVSIGGGGLWLIPSVRTTLSATRRAGEPGRWAGLRAGLGAVVGLTGSSLLAGAGGVALATFLLSADPTSGGLNLTIIALAAVLFGGVSVFGRRAGVFGTVLGVVIVTMIFYVMEVNAVSFYWFEVPFAGLALLGLAVSRAIEGISDALNRPRAPGLGAPPGTGPPPSQSAIG